MILFFALLIFALYLIWCSRSSGLANSSKWNHKRTTRPDDRLINPCASTNLHLLHNGGSPLTNYIQDTNPTGNSFSHHATDVTAANVDNSVNTGGFDYASNLESSGMECSSGGDFSGFGGGGDFSGGGAGGDWSSS